MLASLLGWMILLFSDHVPTLAVPPIAGLSANDLQDTFDQTRGSGKHEAIDIMEPRGTPVHAVVDGTIVKLFLSKPGGEDDLLGRWRRPVLLLLCAPRSVCGQPS